MVYYDIQQPPLQVWKGIEDRALIFGPSRQIFYSKHFLVSKIFTEIDCTHFIFAQNHLNHRKNRF